MPPLFERPDDMRFLPVGHRGAPRELPPNTLAGFARAYKMGCPMVECDVRRSRDGVLVLAHDGHVTDRENRRFAVGETDAATLGALDLGAGEGVPTLAALVDWAVGSGASIMADMKESGDGIESHVARLLAPLPLGRKVVPGAGDDARRRFRAADPHLPLSLSVGYGALNRDRFARFLAERDSMAIDAVTFAWSLLTPRRIDALHATGFSSSAGPSTTRSSSIASRIGAWTASSRTKRRWSPMPREEQTGVKARPVRPSMSAPDR